MGKTYYFVRIDQKIKLGRTILLERGQTKSVRRWNDCPAYYDLIGRGQSLRENGRGNELGRSGCGHSGWAGWMRDTIHSSPGSCLRKSCVMEAPVDDQCINMVDLGPPA
ncbi:hypothetical protein TNCV_1055661 [Trichonephila clavipes]|nr:hypothetical protein TNCV_1055661 [Trichonephila clavipes]